MKFNTLIVLGSLHLLIGCGIQEEINKATNTCGDMISEALEGLEDTCLTKEEILDLINTIRTRANPADEISDQEDTLP